MKIFKSRLILYATICVFAGAACYAEGETDPAYKILASKKYLDSVKVNGVSVGTGGYFYGTSSTADVTCKKEVSGFSSLKIAVGQIITVTPSVTSTCTNTHTLLLTGATMADGSAVPTNGHAIYYNNSTVSKTVGEKIWKAGVPSTFVYNGTGWVFMGKGYDLDTTYASLTDGSNTNTSIIVGTGQTAGIVSPLVLKNSILDTTLTANIGRTAFSLSTDAISASDTIIGAFGKAQGQINSINSAVGDNADAIETINKNIVNGMDFSQGKKAMALQFAGSETTTNPTESTAVRVVSIPAITTSEPPITWTIIAVQPTRTARVDDLAIKLNDSTTSYQVLYNGAATTTATAPIVWNENYPSMFMFDGTKWVFLGKGYDEDTDTNTTYSSMSVSEGTYGTSAEQRTLTATNLKQIIQGTHLSSNFAPTTTGTFSLSSSDTITTAIEKLAGLKQNIIPKSLITEEIAQHTVQLPSLISYDSTNDNIVGTQYGILTHATFLSTQGYLSDLDGSDLTNNSDLDNVIPTVKAVANLLDQLQWTNTETAATNAYETRFDSSSTHTTNYWGYQTGHKLINTAALADALALKQNKITTDRVLFHDDPTNNANDIYVPALVATNAAGTTLSGNTIGLAGRSALEGVGGDGYIDDSAHDNFVPTVRAVWGELNAVWEEVYGKQDFIPATSNIYRTTTTPTAAGSVVTTTTNNGSIIQRGIATAPTYNSDNQLSNGDWIPTMSALMNQVSAATDTLSWGATETAATNAYETGFDSSSTHTTNYWGYQTGNKLITTNALANALALKQNKLPGQDDNLISGQQTGQGWASVLAPTTAGNVTQIGLWDADGRDSAAWDINTYFSSATADERNEINYSIPTVGAVAVGLNQKQNKITTDRVLFHDEPTNNANDIYVPALVSYGTGTNGTDGVLGNKIGILDHNTITHDEGSLYLYADSDGYGAEMDNFVPTVRAVANALESNFWSPFTWNGDTFPAAINAYSTTFDTTSTHVNGNWPRNHQGYLVRADTFANSLALKQNIIPRGTAGQVMTYNGTNDGELGTPLGVLTSLGGEDGDAIENYSTTFNNTLDGNNNGNWLQDSSGKLITSDVLAQGLALKQNELPEKSGGNAAPKGNQAVVLNTSGSPSNVYTTAGGSVGLTIRSGAPAVINYVNGTALSTEEAFTTFTNSTFGTATGDTLTSNKNKIKNALVSLELLKDTYTDLNTKITAASGVSSHTVNGAPLSNGASYFYGSGGGAAATSAKTASIPSITTSELANGQIITVTPQTTSTANNGNYTLKLNNYNAAQIYYNGAVVSTSENGAKVWTAGVPSTFVYETVNDTPRWTFMGHGVDNDTKYSPMTVAVGRTGTATAANVVTARNLKATIHGTKLDNVTMSEIDGVATLSLDTTQTGAIDTNDTIIGAFGKTQGQINTKQNKLPARTTETNYVPSANAGETIKLTSTGGAVEKVYITGGGSTPLTTTSGAYNVINYVTGTPLDAFTTSTFGTDNADNENKIKGALVSLELLRNTYSNLNGKIGTNTTAISGLNGSISAINDTIVNGMVFSDGSAKHLQFAGAEASGATATTTLRVVDIPAIKGANIQPWTVIVVQPSVTAALTGSGALQISINDNQTPYDVYYGDSTVTGSTNNSSVVWNAKYPSTFVFAPVDKSYAWVFAGNGHDAILDLSGHTVNGAPLSNSASYFYGTETGMASSATKIVTANDITSAPTAGMFLIVQPAAQNSAQLSPGNAGTALQMNLNNNGAKPLYYNNAPITSSSVANKVWSPSFPSIWVYQGSGNDAHWAFVAKGYDENTTYDTLNWNATQSTAIGAYNTTFGNNQNNWVGAGNELIDGQFLANALELKQNKLAPKANDARAQAVIRGDDYGRTSRAYITAGGALGLTTNSGAPAVINYVNGTKNETQMATGSFSNDYAPSTNEASIKSALVSLELLRDTYTDLNTKITTNYNSINNAIGNTVVNGMYLDDGKNMPLQFAGPEDNTGVEDGDTDRMAIIPTMHGNSGVINDQTVIVVQPKVGVAKVDSTSGLRLAISDGANRITNSYPILYAGQILDTVEKARVVWNPQYPSIFVYDSKLNGWVFVSNGAVGKTCAEYKPGVQNPTDADCWLWRLP